MQRISKQQLAKNLSHQVPIADDKTPMQALNILLSGWKEHRHFGDKYRHALNARTFLFITEVLDLSEYAGCDLTGKSS